MGRLPGQCLDWPMEPQMGLYANKYNRMLLAVFFILIKYNILDNTRINWTKLENTYMWVGEKCVQFS